MDESEAAVDNCKLMTKVFKSIINYSNLFHYFIIKWSVENEKDKNIIYYLFTSY